jgi:multidrug resistance efflux pump
MEILLTLTYVAICIVVFKIFRITVNQWSLATAGFGGIIGLSLLFITMAYNHPFSSNARIYVAVTPVLPAVNVRMIEVPVELNKPPKKGDVLFRMDPRLYQYMDQKKAALAETEQNVKQLKTSLDQASGAKDRADAELQSAQQNYDRQAELFSEKDIATGTLGTHTRNLEAAKLSYMGANAAEERVRLAPASEIDLDQTVVRASDDGFVTALTPAVYVLPAPSGPAMTFVNTDPQKRALAAAFRQNSLQRVRAGDEAEIAFKAVPGRVFKGKVRTLLDATAGQMQASGTLQDIGATTTNRSRGIALIDIVDDISPYQIPVGSVAEVAIYTDHLKELSLLRRILLRMRSWENYVFLESL